MVAVNKDKRLSVSEIRDMFIVDAETGDIFWRERGMGRHIGKPAGTRMASGPRKVGMRIEGKFVQFFSHHIIWTWVHGKWPEITIDHINGVKDDNRICNLREATYSQNAANKARISSNSSGMKWVCLHKNRVEQGRKSVWQAAVWKDGKQEQSYFESKDEAYAWASSVAQRLHGEFYNTGKLP